MAISEHKAIWGGKPVVDYDPEKRITDPETMAYRLGIGNRRRRAHGSGSNSPDFTELFARLTQDPHVGDLAALVIGTWSSEWNGTVEEVVAMLAGAANRLPRLTSLFIGDITFDENEISWIRQGDISPIFAAFPRLEELGVRGGNGLTLGVPSHPHLKKLVIETGGLGIDVVREVIQADFPALEHLELWLGSDGYGWDGTVEDLAPIFAGNRWPNLTYLGLRNSEIADEIAEALATAPILNRIQILDLSLGALGDAGAQALLDSGHLTGLKKLDVHHHFLSEEMVEQLGELGIEVDADDPQEEDEDGDETYRYIAASE